jgi:integration host factor subunit alpha
LEDLFLNLYSFGVFRRRAMTMTKAELVEIICEKTAFTRQESAEFMEQVFEIIKETLEKGEKIKIAGFGNFVVREKRPRRGRNPKTGEEMTIAERRVLTFRPSQALRKVLNPGVLSSSQFAGSSESPDEIKNF